MLHGGYGDGAQAERSYGWDAQADAGHFVVAYPTAPGPAWNAISCCGIPARSGVDDVAFVTAMVDDIAAQTPVDSTRVYATGMSNGAMMALRLACQTACSLRSPQWRGPADRLWPRQSDVGAADPWNRRRSGALWWWPGPGGHGDGTPNVDGPSVESVNTTWRNRQLRRTDFQLHECGHHPDRDCPNSLVVQLISIEGRTSMARRTAQSAGAATRRPATAIHRDRRHGHDLAVLRRQAPLTSVLAEPGGRFPWPCTAHRVLRRRPEGHRSRTHKRPP